MAEREVLIADAGPLIGLSRIGSLNLLRDLFGQVLMTPEVRDQVLPAADFPDKAAIAAALDAGWLSVRPFPAEDWQPINPGLGTGARSAIAAALRLPGCLLLIDDRAGRLEARAQGLRTIGTAAVIGMAKLAGQIPAARPILERLRPAGYFVPEREATFVTTARSPDLQDLKMTLVRNNVASTYGCRGSG